MADYSWKDTFSALANKLADYEDRQPELVTILRDIGVDKGLEDFLEDGSHPRLKVIDPFTFFSFFMKYGDKKRVQLFSEISKKAGWDIPVPTGFDGVPTAQALNVWLFPFEGTRTDNMIPNLWALFHQAQKHNIDEQLFHAVLGIPGVGFPKLTQCLFYIDPNHYLPIDAQTRPWLLQNAYDIPKPDWNGYKVLLDRLKEKSTKPFYEISYEAWFANQSQAKTSIAVSAQVSYKNDVVEGSTSEQSTTYTAQTLSLNQILYGPPGTGKTYATTELAVKITDPEDYKALCEKYSGKDFRHEIKAKYDDLVSRGRIDFATFHQSFSYEDFIEGIRAETSEESSGLEYKVVDGVFKRIADLASKTIGSENSLGLAESPTIWKISIGRRDEVDMRNHYINAGEARIGWNDTGDLSVPLDDRDVYEQKYWNGLTSPNHNVLNDFSENMKVGDVLLCFKDQYTVRAIGVVTSEYRFDVNASELGDRYYSHVRDVNWQVKGISLDVRHLNGGKRMVQKTLYPLGRMNWKSLIFEVKRQEIHIPGIDSTAESKPSPNHVIIIDEINRGNTARIFGELITLLEPDKRKGGSDERTVTLPYSKEPFTVPSNLYVIGTMNTADKSLAQLDLALRRRFEFVEVMPDTSLLENVWVHDISIQRLLQTINDRIEVLLDRDHLIGHSYFLPLKSAEDEPSRINLLADIFKKRVIPLLQEYFFTDWEKIGWVLNDIGKPKEFRFVQLGESENKLGQLFSADIAAELIDRRYQINEEAFHAPQAYQGIFL